MNFTQNKNRAYLLFLRTKFLFAFCYDVVAAYFTVYWMFMFVEP